MTSSYTKDPAATLDYKFDWRAKTNQDSESPELTDWLGSTETIASFTISSSALNSGSVTISGSYLANDDTSVVVWISGGDLYNDYDVTCRITTDSTPVARVDERTIRIQVRNR